MAVRRLGSVAALAFLDVSGVALGLYSALAIRELVFGTFPPLWGVMWQAVEEWLPFLALITLLVFWQGGPVCEPRGAGRDRPDSPVARPRGPVDRGVRRRLGARSTRSASSPTAVVTTTIAIGVLRASYEAVTRDVLRVAGVRRRAVLVGKGEHLLDLRRALGSGRGGINYAFEGAVVSDATDPGLRVLGGIDALPDVLEQTPMDELIVTEGGHRRDGAARNRRAGPPARREGTGGAEDDRVADGTGRCARAGCAAVRSPAAGLRRDGLGRQARLRPGRRAACRDRRAAIWLLIALAIKLDSRGPVLYRSHRVGLNERSFGMLKFRTMEAGADERQDELEEHNEATGPLFKIRDDPRVTRVGALPPALLARRGAAGAERDPRRDEPRRPAAAAGPRLRAASRTGTGSATSCFPGMTGLWQISGRSELTFDDLVRLDFYYLDNWSIWLDVSILLKTLPAVLGPPRRVLSRTGQLAQEPSPVETCRGLRDRSWPFRPPHLSATAMVVGRRTRLRQAPSASSRDVTGL